jgi:hypothetical protein
MVVVKVVSYEVKYWEGAWWACVCFGPAPPSAATYKEHTAFPFQPLTTKFGFLRCQPLSNLSGQKVSILHPIHCGKGSRRCRQMSYP